jgi:hypothetical protein
LLAQAAAETPANPAPFWVGSVPSSRPYSSAQTCPAKWLVPGLIVLGLVGIAVFLLPRFIGNTPPGVKAPGFAVGCGEGKMCAITNQLHDPLIVYRVRFNGEVDAYHWDVLKYPPVLSRSPSRWR